MKPVADDQMVRNALGTDYERMAEPPNADVPSNHALWPKISAALREVYDPEIPVNIYELGLIYRITLDHDNNASVQMTLTTPHCPVAEEMPGMCEAAIASVAEVKSVKVDLVWDPPWDPSMMAETAKLQLNMF